MHTPASITEIIDRDLREHPDLSNSHGVDLGKCRVTPMRVNCADGCDDNNPIQLWLVLREKPDSAAGYLVVFDAERGMFGLAIDGAPRPTFIGLYGSFTETLAGM
jgi:hypothetical protein